MSFSSGFLLQNSCTLNPFYWEEHLRPLCMAYNPSVQLATGFTPFSLMFERQTQMPIDVMLEEKSPSEHTANPRERLESAYQRVREQMNQWLDRQKDFYSKKVHWKPNPIGDLVWLHSTVVPRGRAKKFH